MTNFETMTVGERLKFLRQKKHLSLMELANISGISIGYLCDIEHSRYENLPLSTLLTICRAFGITVSRFLRGIE